MCTVRNGAILFSPNSTLYSEQNQCIATNERYTDSNHRENKFELSKILHKKYNYCERKLKMLVDKQCPSSNVCSEKFIPQRVLQRIKNANFDITTQAFLNEENSDIPKLSKQQLLSLFIYDKHKIADAYATKMELKQLYEREKSRSLLQFINEDFKLPESVKQLYLTEEEIDQMLLKIRSNREQKEKLLKVLWNSNQLLKKSEQVLKKNFSTVNKFEKPISRFELNELILRSRELQKLVKKQL